MKSTPRLRNGYGCSVERGFASNRSVRRRDVVRLALCTAFAALGLMLDALSLAAQPEAPQRPHRIGVLNEAWAANHPTVEGLRAGLRELGFEEGRDVTLDIRFTEGKPEATAVAAAALVKAGVDLIFTSNEAATEAAKAAKQHIHIRA